MKISLPDVLLFGYWGIAISPSLMIVSSDYKDNIGLITHESRHQEQQRRDGTLTFWWNYFTDTNKRFEYELDAYKEWYRVAPNDLYKCGFWLANNYGVDNLTEAEAEKLISGK